MTWFKQLNKDTKNLLLLGLCFFVAVGGCGLWVYHGYAQEQARWESLTPEEQQVEIEATKEKEQQAKEARKKEQAKDRAFEEEMKSYNSERLEFKGGKRGAYAEFLLTDVAVDSKYIFGQDLPTGEHGSLYMSGRGSAGVGQSGDKMARWHRAGTYGIYKHKSRDVYSMDEGDYLEFKNLSMVEIRINF